MLNEIDLSRADLNLLVLFETVLAEGHVGRAAERLDLTASAVSHGLGRLRRMMNDPLFLRTPRGVVPTARATARATALAEPVAEILARTRAVLASAAPFDPATSTRRFVIGAPDGVSAVLLPGLLAALARTAPGIDLGLRQVLPAPVPGPERAWLGVLAELDAREMDLAVIPAEPGAARFEARAVYAEDFVIGVRAGHPFAAEPTLERFCDLRHLVVSLTGDPRGLRRRGARRARAPAAGDADGAELRDGAGGAVRERSRRRAAAAVPRDARGAVRGGSRRAAAGAPCVPDQRGGAEGGADGRGRGVASRLGGGRGVEPSPPAKDRTTSALRQERTLGRK
jgi:DNA-binding transcriptional LysR family regulator